MAAITPTPVPDLGTALPDPSDRTTYGTRGRALWDWEVNAMVPAINALAADTYSNALQSEESALIAVAAANFKGSWAALSGALAVPAAVWHSGRVWALMVSLANVASSEPGVTGDWVDVGGVKRSGDTMTGHLSTIAGASGANVPQAQETAMLATTQFSHRNKIINGNFNINQRGYVSGTATASANQYTLDCWRVVVSGQSITFSASGNGNIVTAPAGGFEHVIEGANLEGGTFVINWLGTATCTVNGTARTKGESFTLPANTNCTVRFSNGTVGLVQLEQGTKPTLFEHRPLGAELSLCQRISEKVTGVVIYAYQQTGTSFGVFVPFKQVKRAAPAVAITAIGASSNASNSAISSVTPYGCIYSVNAVAIGVVTVVGVELFVSADF